MAPRTVKAPAKKSKISIKAVMRAAKALKKESTKKATSTKRAAKAK